MLRLDGMVPCSSRYVNISGTANVLFWFSGTCSECPLYLL
jgi:hypothetical protein